MRELFIYYRAKVDDAPALQAAVAELHANLRSRFPGLQARLLRRPEAADGLHTWMETYALPSSADHAAPRGISDALHAQIEQEARATLSAWIVGPRHVELFDACA